MVGERWGVVPGGVYPFLAFLTESNECEVQYPFMHVAKNIVFYA